MISMLFGNGWDRPVKVRHNDVSTEWRFATKVNPQTMRVVGHALALVVRPGSVADMALLRRDPRHPSLHFKKVGKFWLARTARSVSRCPTVYSGSGSEPTQNTLASPVDNRQYLSVAAERWSRAVPRRRIRPTSKSNFGPLARALAARGATRTP